MRVSQQNTDVPSVVSKDQEAFPKPTRRNKGSRTTYIENECIDVDYHPGDDNPGLFPFIVPEKILDILRSLYVRLCMFVPDRRENLDSRLKRLLHENVVIMIYVRTSKPFPLFSPSFRV